MDEDNNDVPRVTRARTRRLSTLDVDSRSSTPLLDATVERASPRPMRKTRLNSATTDLRTPTRSTRLSVARGETPEPITPSVSSSATKRGTRTPAKSVRKPPFPLKEELLEEGNEEPVKEIKKEVVEYSHDRRVTRAMSKTPPVLSLLANTIPQPQFDINNSSEDKQTKEVIEIVDTPPFTVEQLPKSDDGENKTSSITSSMINKPAKLQVKLRSISMDKPGDSPAKSENPKSQAKNEKTVIDKGEPKPKEDDMQEDSDTPTEYNTPDVSIEEVKAAKVKQEEPAKAKEDIVQVNNNSPEKTEPQANATQEVNTELNEEPVVHNVEQIQDKEVVVHTDKEVVVESDKETSLKEPDSKESETRKSVDQKQPININNNEEPVIVQTEQTKDNDAIAQDDESRVVDNVTMEELVVQPETDPIVEVIQDIRLPDLTPRIMSRVVETKPVEVKKKSVDFGRNAKVQTDEKPIYPKTPARLTPTSLNKMATGNDKDIGTKTETPLKGMLLKKRHSSTPLAKSDESSVVNPPPLQIDVIESLVDMESKSVPEIQSNKEKLARRLVSEDEEEDEDEHELDGDPGVCEFFDNEVEVVDNYESGDSQNSSERREILENQIPHDGESVGSQDTIEDDSEESEDDNLSFIVSDNDVEEGNDGDDDIEELCFSPEPESVDSGDAKGGKKRRRIIVHDSSDEEENRTDDVTAEKENNSKEQSPCESMNKNKNASEKESNIKEKSIVKDSQDVDPKKSDSLPLKGDDSEIEEVHSSSDEGEEHEHEKSINNNNNKSIYEVPDSSDESSETDGQNSAGNSSPTKANEQLSQEKEKSISRVDSPTPMTEDLSTEDKAAIPDTVEKTVESTSKSSSFHNKEKREEEAALLDELSSCKLSHLQQMFNPLQKSRRQTLYHQGPEMSDDTERKPKMKRRSEQLNSDVKPSQSFIETLVEEKSQRLKRKHMSKSFCGTADDLDTSAVQEVKSKKAKKTCDDDASTATGNLAEAKSQNAKKTCDDDEQADQIESSTATGILVEAKSQKAKKTFDDDEIVQMKSSTANLAEAKSKKAKKTCDDEQADQMESSTATANLAEAKSKKAKKTCDDEQADQMKSSTATANLAELKALAPDQKPSNPPKDTAFYMDYCDTILQAANEAMLEQKKQRVASGKKTKTVVRSKSKTASDALELPPVSEAVAPIAVNPEFEKATKIKKDVKRLQATKQAVKHAVQLLVPDLANKEPQSLARKLSPQPQAAANAKNTKVKKQIVKRKKPQVLQVSPAKSSDEENRHAVKRIKTSAGYCVESHVDKDGIELIKTRSGIMKSEPCTPTQKYFKEVPSTPYSRSGFAEHSATSKAAKKKLATGGQSNVNRNPATESALRFKREIFGRSSK